MVMGLFPSDVIVQLNVSCVVVAVTMTILGASGGTIDNNIILLQS